MVGVERNPRDEAFAIHGLREMECLGGLAKVLSRPGQFIVQLLLPLRQETADVFVQGELARLQPRLRLDQSRFVLVAEDRLLDQQPFQGTGVEMKKEVARLDMGAFRYDLENGGRVEISSLDVALHFHVQSALDRAFLDDLVDEGPADRGAGQGNLSLGPAPPIFEPNPTHEGENHGGDTARHQGLGTGAMTVNFASNTSHVAAPGTDATRLLLMAGGAGRTGWTGWELFFNRPAYRTDSRLAGLGINQIFRVDSQFRIAGRVNSEFGKLL